MKLVIAEKPSVAMALAAVLGANEKKDGYLEGGGYLVICRSCRTNGNMRCRRTRRNSLTFCAG